MNLQVVPLPKTKDADLLVTLAGVGLCSYKTTEQKAESLHAISPKRRAILNL